MPELLVRTKRPHAKQRAFLESPAKRKVIRAGRRGGKTTGVALLAVDAFLDGQRVLYATPTSDQIDTFWNEVKNALAEPLEAGLFYKNESRHIIELAGTHQRIRAKTAWNADSLRGDYADLLILDEWQLMAEDAWDKVGAPMLLDNDGYAVFIYTPPSLESRSASKATDPRHAAKMYAMAEADESGRWEAFHFTSFDNPHISEVALGEINKDVGSLAYRMEILAQDVDEVPGALWSHNILDETRVNEHPAFYQVAVGVDPHATTGETGIIVAGASRLGKEAHGYVIADATKPGKPNEWGSAAIAAYHTFGADIMVAEINHGGDMVENVIRNLPGGKRVRYATVRATRGKYVRAQPISAIWAEKRGHIVGYLPALEEELCTWFPGMPSPNRLDAMVWAMTQMNLAAGYVTMEDIGEMGTIEDYRHWATDSGRNGHRRR